MSKLAIASAIIVGVPALCRRVRIPDAVGLLTAEVVIGPHGSGMMDEHHPVAAFFVQLAILLLMFLAGLELDFDLFQTAKSIRLVTPVTFDSSQRLPFVVK